MNWLKENWFKIFILVAIWGIIYIYWNSQKISVVKYCRDSAYKNSAILEIIEDNIETCLNTIKKYK